MVKNAKLCDAEASGRTYIPSKRPAYDIGGREEWGSKVGSVVGSVVTHVDKGDVNTRPTDYSIGDIVRVLHVVPSLNPASTLGEKHVGYVDNTGPVVGKCRPSVVIGIFKYCLVCIPIWTSSGQGIKPHEADDCLWLRRWDDDHLIWNNTTESQYLMVSKKYQSRDSAYINLTQAFPVQYQCPIGHIGSLTPTSCERLKKLWLISARKGFERISRQLEFQKDATAEIPLTGEFEQMRADIAELSVGGDEFTTVSYDKYRSIRRGSRVSSVSRWK